VDIAVSVVTMAMTVLLGVAAAFMGLGSVAFLDYCPPETCSAEGAINSVLGALALAGLVTLAGILITVIRLTMRKLAWPFAVGTLVACVVILGGGVVAYSVAVS
jgi:hypothetical protein